jgi:hypothetical protein
MDWINLAKDRDWRWIIVNEALNHTMRWTSRMAEKLLVSQEELCSMKLLLYGVQLHFMVSVYGVLPEHRLRHSPPQKLSIYKILHKNSDLDGGFVMT